MIEEQFTDTERRRLISVAMNAFPPAQGDDELTAIIAGTDTVLIAQRTYRSRRTTPARRLARAVV
jgi:hypothetical protein